MGARTHACPQVRPVAEDAPAASPMIVPPSYAVAQAASSLLDWQAAQGLAAGGRDGPGGAGTGAGAGRVLGYDPAIGRHGAFYFMDVDGGDEQQQQRQQEQQLLRAPHAPGSPPQPAAAAASAPFAGGEPADSVMASAWGQGREAPWDSPGATGGPRGAGHGGLGTVPLGPWQQAWPGGAVAPAAWPPPEAEQAAGPGHRRQQQQQPGAPASTSMTMVRVARMLDAVARVHHWAAGADDAAAPMASSTSWAETAGESSSRGGTSSTPCRLGAVP